MRFIYIFEYIGKTPHHKATVYYSPVVYYSARGFHAYSSDARIPNYVFARVSGLDDGGRDAIPTVDQCVVLVMVAANIFIIWRRGIRICRYARRRRDARKRQRYDDLMLLYMLCSYVREWRCRFDRAIAMAIYLYR